MHYDSHIFIGSRYQYIKELYFNSFLTICIYSNKAMANVSLWPTADRYPLRLSTQIGGTTPQV